ncbi:MAG: hypothetical protein JW740_03255 [Candidatus Zambryskibacteria bacterium]|nr:hypothetical protein [Candidatus Zambryskibacteria bacterium]
MGIFIAVLVFLVVYLCFSLYLDKKERPRIVPLPPLRIIDLESEEPEEPEIAQSIPQFLEKEILLRSSGMKEVPKHFSMFVPSLRRMARLDLVRVCPAREAVRVRLAEKPEKGRPHKYYNIPIERVSLA